MIFLRPLVDDFTQQTLSVLQMPCSKLLGNSISRELETVGNQEKAQKKNCFKEHEIHIYLDIHLMCNIHTYYIGKNLILIKLAEHG